MNKTDKAKNRTSKNETRNKKSIKKAHNLKAREVEEVIIEQKGYSKK